MPYPLPLTRTEAYLAYKAGVIQQSDLKPSLAVPRNGIDAWLAYWTGLADTYPVKGVGKNIFDDSIAFENGYIATYGDIVASQNSAVNPKYYGVVQNTDYTFSYSVVTNGTMVRNIAFYDNGKNFISRVQNASTETSITVHAPAGACYMRFNFYNANGITATDFPASYLSNIQLEKGTQASAYEEYTGEPLILQEEEAYIAYLCGVINEYPEKCLRRVGAYLRYLISARWGRPDHPLNREELYLSLIKTQFIPSGDPSSDIVIDGTAKAAFVDVKMYGDTFQQSYTGKNLLGASLATMQSENTGGTWSGGAYTRYGVTVTPVFSNGLLQRIELSGTATSNFTFRVSKSYSKSEFEAIATAGETYTLSGCPSGGSPTTYYLRVMENPYKNIYTDVGEGLTRQMPSISSGATAVWLVIGVDSGTDTTGLVYRPQFEKSAAATSYEPYVGGQASPNPEYPQTIQAVTGRQVVNVQGKNLFTNIPTGSNNGVDFTLNNDGTYDIDGRATAQANKSVFITDLSKLSDGSTYSLSATKALPSGVQVMCEVFNGTATWVRHALGADGFLNSSRQSITGQLNLSGGDRLKLTLRVQNGTTVDLGNLGVQLELGSTATTYEPYSSNDYEINLGKNLFNKDNYTDADGYYIGSSGRYTAASNNHTAIIPIEPNTTYTVSKPAQATYNRFRVGISDTLVSAGDYFSIWGGSDEATSVTLTSGSQSKYMYIYYAVTINVSDAIASLMLEKGATATTYAPYFAPIELCKLGNYQDYIYKDGDDWKVHKATNAVTLTGAEYWQYENVGTSATFFQLQNSRWDEAFGANTHPIGEGAGVVQPTAAFACDGLKSIDASDTNMKINQGCGKKGIWFRIALLNTWNVSTAEQLQTWLSTHNMKLKYALANPTDTVITNQNLINQLNALKQGGAEEGTTYIKVNATDPNLPGLLYVEAPKYE